MRLVKSVGPSSFLDWFVIVLVFLPTICYLSRNFLWGLIMNPLHILGIQLPFESLRLQVYKALDNDSVLLGIIAAEYIIHLFETLFLLKPQLDAHEMSFGVRFQWYVMGLIEGFAPIKRLKSLITQQERKHISK